MQRIFCFLCALLVPVLVSVPAMAAEPLVSTGVDHSLMLDTDGTVWAWGDNTNGQLGDNSVNDRPLPVRVQNGGSNLSNVIKVSAGSRYSLALIVNGTVMAWGRGVNGVLGNNDVADQTSAVVVQQSGGATLTNVIDISAGHYVSLALKADGTVWAWGNDLYGALGDAAGNSGILAQAVQVSGMSDIISIGAGTWTSYAVRADGTAWAWGWNGSNGSLGNGTTGGSVYLPQQVLASAGSPLTNMVSVTGGAYYAMGLTSYGYLYAWGQNDQGQLGLGDTTNRLFATFVTSGIRQCSAGLMRLDAFGNEEYGVGGSSLAVRSTGEVIAWGRNDLGQLGLGDTVNRLSPASVPGAGLGRQASAGSRLSTMLRADGLVRAAGSDADGGIGDGGFGGTVPSFTVCDAPWALTGITATAGGNAFTLGLKGDGTVWAWGNNGSGQLGDGTYNFSALPVQVQAAGGSPLTNIIAIAAGGYHGVALDAAGRVWTWGNNDYGQLGSGAAGGSATQASVAKYKSGTNFFELSGVNQISATAYATLGQYVAYPIGFGNVNSYMYPSDGTADAKSLPYMGYIRSSAGGFLWPIRAIEGGWLHSGVVMSDGSVRVFGNNGNGQHGVGNTTAVDYASNVAVLGGLAKGVATGQSHSAFLMANGTVKSCGYDGSGQLGDGAANNGSNVLSPVAVGISNVKAIAVGTDFCDLTFVHLSGGTVQGWGRNLLNTATSALGCNDTASAFLDAPVPVRRRSGIFTFTLSGVATLSAGDYGGSAANANGTVVSWGQGNSGQLGNNDTTTDQATAVTTINHWVPTIDLSVIDVAGSEPGFDTMTVRATRSGPLVGSGYVTLASAGTASPGSDYTTSIAPGNVLRIPQGEATADVTITPLDDQIDEDDETAQASVGGSLYSRAGGTPNVITRISDDDTAGVVFSSISGPTTEAGGTATFTVRLATQPTADVSVAIASTNVQEGQPDVVSLTFTPSDWNVDQVVTLTGQPDQVDDDDQLYGAQVGPCTSGDPKYQGLGGGTVTVVNQDIDTAGVSVFGPFGNSREDGSGVTVFVRLNSKPTGPVRVPMVGILPSEIKVTPEELVFDGGNWDLFQAVDCYGQPDSIDDGDQVVQIAAGPTDSGDGKYVGLSAASALFLNEDIDTAGIEVIPVFGYTIEGSSIDGIYVRLRSKPIAAVSFTVAHLGGQQLLGLDSSDISATAVVLDFTPADWDTYRLVFIAAIDDVVIDGDVATTINLDGTSVDPLYQGMSTSVPNLAIDNDAAGIQVNRTALTTTESLSGSPSTDTVIVSLTAMPSADVSIQLTIPSSLADNGDAVEPVEGSFDGSVDPATGPGAVTTVTITPAQWQTGVPVVVWGRRGSIGIQDGPISYDLQADPSTSADGNFSGLSSPTVTVTNYDLDVPGVTITQTGGSTQVTEGSLTDSYTVVLNTNLNPGETVIVYPQPPGGARFTISPPFLVFTDSGAKAWNLPQTVTLTAIDDQVAQGGSVQAITHLTDVSVNPGYDQQTFASLNVSIADDDNATITVTPTAGLTTTESGTTANFTVVLTSQPTANVVIPLNPSGIAPFEGEIASGGAFTTGTLNLTFTAANWFSPQTVTVRGRDDSIDDGNQPYSIVVGTPTSGPANYTAINPPDVNVVNADDDTVGYVVSTMAGPTSEAGLTSAFTVRLASQPTTDVVLTVTSSRPGEALVRRLGVGSFTIATTLTFTAANWSTDRTVEVKGQADGSIDDGDQAFAVLIGADTNLATDAKYRNLPAPQVAGTNQDLDNAGIVVSAISGPTSESGGSATFSMVLTSRPTANVTIPLSSSDPTEGGFDRTQVTFAPGNWNVPQVVTANGLIDGIDDGDIVWQAVTGLAISSDGAYNGLPSADVSITNTDIDAAGILVAPAVSPAPQQEGVRYLTSEDGLTAGFTVVLNAKPTGTVSLTVAALNALEGVVSPSTVSFTTDNWNVPQDLTVSGLGNGPSEADADYLLALGPASSSDAAYQGRFFQTVPMRNKPVNAKPTVDPISDQSITEPSVGDPAITLVITGLGSGQTRESQSLTIAAVSDNPGLIPDPVISYTPGSTTAALTYVPVAENSGSARITLTIQDSGGTALGGIDTIIRSFAIVVKSLNDQPTFTPGGDLTVVEDAGFQNQPGWATAISAGPANEAGQILTFEVTNSDPTLFSLQPMLANDGTLTYLTNPDAFGTVTVSVVLTDDGGTADGGIDRSATAAFLISVTSRNDGPTFTAGADVTVAEDATAQSIAWATGISPGPANESGQSLTFQVVGATSGLYTVMPSIAPNGTLTFTPAPQAFGSDTLVVTATDNGGTANGGADTSALVPLVLTITSVNDEPVVTVNTGLTVFVGGSASLTQALLDATDVETPTDHLVLRLLLPPASGNVELDGIPVLLNGTVTRGALVAGRVAYVHGAGPGISDGFAFRVEDEDGGQSEPEVFLITVDRSVPIVDLNGTAPVFVENSVTPVFIADAALISDGDSANFDTGQIRVTLTGGGPGATVAVRDQGTGSGQVSVSGTDISIDGQLVGSYSGGTVGSPLIISCGAAMTPANATLVVRQLVFSTPTDDPPTSAVVSVQVTDDNNDTSPDVPRTVTITPINDLPVIVAPLLPVPGNGSATGAITITDPDSPSLTITIDRIPTKGTIGGIAADGSYLYVALPGRSGDDSFDLSVFDGSATVAATVPVRISGTGTTARPWIVSDPPLEATAGDILRSPVRVLTSGLPPGFDVTFGLTGAPGGMTITKTGPDTAEILWSIPGGTDAHVGFTITTSESVSGSAASQAVLMRVSPTGPIPTPKGIN